MTIPDDIRESARQVADATVNRFLDLGMMTVVPNAERERVAETIARALMAERERWERATSTQEDSPLLPPAIPFNANP